MAKSQDAINQAAAQAHWTAYNDALKAGKTSAEAMRIVVGPRQSEQGECEVTTKTHPIETTATTRPQTPQALKARFPLKPYERLPRGWKPPTATPENMREVVEQGIAIQLYTPGVMESNESCMQDVRWLLAQHGDYPKQDPALAPRYDAERAKLMWHALAELLTPADLVALITLAKRMVTSPPTQDDFDEARESSERRRASLKPSKTRVVGQFN